MRCKQGSKELQKRSCMVEDAIEDLIGLALEFKQPGNVLVNIRNESVFCLLELTNNNDKTGKKICSN